MVPFRVTDASQLDAAGRVVRPEIEDLVRAREVLSAIHELVGGVVIAATSAGVNTSPTHTKPSRR
jgi:hypothetical protein